MKSSKILFVMLLAFMLTGSCKKEEAKPDCQVNGYGTITISNSSTNPYDIYIDGIYNMQLSGKSISTKININEGNNRKMYAVQVSGYVLYPTDKTTYFNVIRCSDYSWQVP